MKARMVFSLLFLAGLLWLAMLPGFAKEYADHNVPLLSGMDYEYQPEPGDEYGIATTDFLYQSDPAIAHCHGTNKYLAVYEYDDEIYGQRLHDWGQPQGSPFIISNGTDSSYNPDVACNADDNFIVVWEWDYELRFILRARHVAGSQQTGSQLLGSEITVDEHDLSDVRAASLACNADVPTCLVVYERILQPSNASVYGQRISISGAEISQEGEHFRFMGDYKTGTQTPRPDVAWGPHDGTYLAVWSAYDSENDVFNIYYTPVYDTHQTSGDQRYFVPIVMGPGTLPGNSTHPSVAASTEADTSDRFLVVWEHSGNILALYHHAYAKSFVTGYFGIAQVPFDSQPVVAYSGGPQGETGDYLDQYLITFYRQFDNDRRIMAQGIEGSYEAANEAQGHLVGTAREIASSGVPDLLDFGPLDVVGSAYQGHYLIVWENIEGGSLPDTDIWGQIVYPDCYSLEKTLDPECPNCSISATLPRCFDNTLYAHGVNASLLAVDYGDYFFTHWSGDASGTFPSTSIKMIENKSVTAHFAQAETCYTLTTAVTPGSSGSVTAEPSPNCSDGINYRENTHVTLTANPESGYTFNKWSGYIVSYDNPVTVVMNGDKNVMANFVETTTCYALTTAVDPPAGGAIQAEPDPNCEGGQYTENTIVSLTANPNAGYAFSNWEGDASGSSSPTQVVMSDAKAVTAAFDYIGQKQVLIDEAHDNQLTLDEARAMALGQEAPWKGGWEYFYLDQLKTLLADHYTLLSDPDTSLTYDQLINYAAVVIPHYYEEMTAAEIAAIQKYVASGGGLIFLGECGYSPTDPELTTSYWIDMPSPCLFQPDDSNPDNLDGDIQVDNIWFGGDNPEVNTFTLNWGQSVGTWGEGLWIADTWNDDHEIWRDDDGDETIGTGELGIYGVVVGYDTGCGRVAALGDDTFSDGALQWTENDSLFKALLDWVTAGYPCPVNQKKVLLDEYHDNYLTLDHNRAQEIVDGQGWGDVSAYQLAILGTEMINDYAFENNPNSPLSAALLAHYDALVIPWYFDAMTAEEVQAVHDFVTQGGGVIFLGDSAYDNPNPELAGAYDMAFNNYTLYAPVPEAGSDIVIDSIIQDFAGFGDFTMTWGGSVDLWGGAFWIGDTFGKNAWRDKDWNETYTDPPDEANDFNVWGGYDTGCGRVMIYADDGFSDAHMSFTNNARFMETMLDWVTEGAACQLNMLFLPVLLR